MIFVPAYEWMECWELDTSQNCSSHASSPLYGLITCPTLKNQLVACFTLNAKGCSPGDAVWLRVLPVLFLALLDMFAYRNTASQRSRCWCKLFTLLKRVQIVEIWTTDIVSWNIFIAFGLKRMNSRHCKHDLEKGRMFKNHRKEYCMNVHLPPDII